MMHIFLRLKEKRKGILQKKTGESLQNNVFWFVEHEYKN
jgi:hypothetical protein